MSIPKEKLIIQEIKEIVNHFGLPKSTPAYMRHEWNKIKNLVNNYVDPGYIGAPIVGDSEGPETID